MKILEAFHNDNKRRNVDKDIIRALRHMENGIRTYLSDRGRHDAKIVPTILDIIDKILDVYRANPGLPTSIVSYDMRRGYPEVLVSVEYESNEELAKEEIKYGEAIRDKIRARHDLRTELTFSTNNMGIDVEFLSSKNEEHLFVNVSNYKEYLLISFVFGRGS